MEETLPLWVTDPRGGYLDGTIGDGGHAEALLTRWPDAFLIGCDRDPGALETSAARLARFGDRVRLVQADLGDLERVWTGLGCPALAGILFDLGLSSRQIDDPARGFSYWTDGPLRMVLDRDRTGDASTFLAEVEEGDLVRIFRELGELPGAGRAARAVMEARARGRLTTTGELAEALRRGGIRTPRRLSQAFQAVRLHVNGELDSLDRGLAAAARVLPAGATLTAISFESLMDRRVKRTFRPLPSHRPVAGVVDPKPLWEPLTRRPVRPAPDEVRRNPRSRSARLRAARRTDA